MAIGRNGSIGTPHAHYAPPSDGPFLCLRCLHYKALPGEVSGNCDHPDVKEDAEAGLLPMHDDKPVVHHEGCCNYFQTAQGKLAQMVGGK